MVDIEESYLEVVRLMVSQVFCEDENDETKCRMITTARMENTEVRVSLDTQYESIGLSGCQRRIWKMIVFDKVLTIPH